jgi:hypothetical protein
VPLPGTKASWREICVSELEIWGRSGRSRSRPRRPRRCASGRSRGGSTPTPCGDHQRFLRGRARVGAVRVPRQPDRLVRWRRLECDRRDRRGEVAPRDVGDHRSDRPRHLPDRAESWPLATRRGATRRRPADDHRDRTAGRAHRRPRRGRRRSQPGRDVAPLLDPERRLTRQQLFQFYADAFAHLDVLDVSRSYLSESGCAALRGVDQGIDNDGPPFILECASE